MRQLPVIVRTHMVSHKDETNLRTLGELADQYLVSTGAPTAFAVHDPPQRPFSRPPSIKKDCQSGPILEITEKLQTKNPSYLWTASAVHLGTFFLIFFFFAIFYYLFFCNSLHIIFFVIPFYSIFLYLLSYYIFLILISIFCNSLHNFPLVLSTPSSQVPLVLSPTSPQVPLVLSSTSLQVH